MPNAGSELSLRDLTSPLGADRFIENHVLPGVHFLSAGGSHLVDALLSIDQFRDLSQLVKSLEAVQLLGPEGFRSVVPGPSAMDFYHRGDVLYMTNVEKVVPRAAEMFRRVAVDLGVHPRHLMLEAFAGRRHAVSSLHYDHDTNFQILLRGSKHWHVQPNHHILNPIVPSHRLSAPREEALARQLPLPLKLRDLDNAIEITTEPGTCLFLPLGYWHYVEMSDDCFAINVVLNPQRWFEVIGGAARRRLIGMPELRAPVLGALSEPDSPLRNAAERQLAFAIEAYARAVRELRLEDIGLATDTTAMRWSAECTLRSIEETECRPALVCPGLSADPLELDTDLAPLMRRLVQFCGSFGVPHLSLLAPELSSGSLLRLMLEMKQMGYFEDAS